MWGFSMKVYFTKPDAFRAKVKSNTGHKYIYKVKPSNRSTKSYWYARPYYGNKKVKSFNTLKEAVEFKRMNPPKLEKPKEPKFDYDNEALPVGLGNRLDYTASSSSSFVLSQSKM